MRSLVTDVDALSVDVNSMVIVSDMERSLVSVNVFLVGDKRSVFVLVLVRSERLIVTSSDWVSVCERRLRLCELVGVRGTAVAVIATRTRPRNRRTGMFVVVAWSLLQPSGRLVCNMRDGRGDRATVCEHNKL